MNKIERKKEKIVFEILARAESGRGVVCADERRFCGDGSDRETVRGKMGNHNFVIFYGEVEKNESMNRSVTRLW